MKFRLPALLKLKSLAAALALLPVLAAAAPLNDTGITACWDDAGIASSAVAADTGSYPRQDCRYGRDPYAAIGMPKTGAGGAGFDFSKIANDGSVLDASAALGSGPGDWACTRDNVTGLVWEVKTTSGLRGLDHTYTWYNSDPATNGGAVGTASGGTCATGGRCDTEKFVADVNAASLCGASDWRMPSKKELISIGDYSRSYPAIDPTFFPNTLGSFFWSESSYANNSIYAWKVNFDNSEVFWHDRSAAYHVRLTRSVQ